jgi:cation/acetate symporter
MSIYIWTYLLVGITFGVYAALAWRARSVGARGFYVAGPGVPAVFNGMATAADWMSAASIISMAGIISSSGYSGSVYLMGWTGGYVLLALLLAPHLRKFGKFTVPDFVGDRYYSNGARIVALICAILVSFAYLCGQMRGVGIVFSRFLGVGIDTAVIIGMVIVFLFAAVGGMKGVTATQAAQCALIIVAYVVPAAAISMKITGQPLPQLGLGMAVTDGPHGGQYLLEVLNQIHRDLGFAEFTSPFGPGKKSMLDMCSVTLALMVGTAGLPHIIVRFYAVQTVAAARLSVGYALLFVTVVYSTAPALAAFSRYAVLEGIHDTSYAQAPAWFHDWEKTGLTAWMDKNGDGKIQYRPGDPFIGKPSFTGSRGPQGEALLSNRPTDNSNEVYIDSDMIVAAGPEITGLSNWAAGLVAAGCLSAAMSTAAGLLLVIGSAASNDLYYRLINPGASERQQLIVSRIAIGTAICIAGYFALNPPAQVAQMVAFGFGLAAASFFPVVVLGIFSWRTTREAAIAGMISGTAFTGTYICSTALLGGDRWCLGISPEGIGAVGMVLNFAVTGIVSRLTPPPPDEVRNVVEYIRYPSGAGAASDSPSFWK